MGNRIEEKVAVYAVNIADLSECFPVSGLGGIILTDFCTGKSPIIYPEQSRVDSGSVVLDGPASKDVERVTALVEVLQKIYGPRKIGRRVRVYKQGPRGGWTEIRS